MQLRMSHACYCFCPLQVRVRPTPTTPLADLVSHEEWYQWKPDASVFDLTWPERGIFATSCSCMVGTKCAFAGAVLVGHEYPLSHWLGIWP